jgi:hypothetical protein
LSVVSLVRLWDNTEFGFALQGQLWVTFPRTVATPAATEAERTPDVPDGKGDILARRSAVWGRTIVPKACLERQRVARERIRSRASAGRGEQLNGLE